VVVVVVVVVVRRHCRFLYKRYAAATRLCENQFDAKFTVVVGLSKDAKFTVVVGLSKAKHLTRAWLQQYQGPGP